MNVAKGTGGAAELRVKGRRVDIGELTEELFKVAETDRDLVDPSQPSEVIALIRADRALPFREIRKILDACEDPEVRIYKVQFAVFCEPR